MRKKHALEPDRLLRDRYRGVGKPGHLKASGRNMGHADWIGADAPDRCRRPNRRRRRRRREIGAAEQVRKPSGLMRIVRAPGGDQMIANPVENTRDAARLDGDEAERAAAEPGLTGVVVSRADKRRWVDACVCPPHEVGLRPLHAQRAPPRAVDRGRSRHEVHEDKPPPVFGVGGDERMAEDPRPRSERLATGEFAVFQPQRFPGKVGVPDAERRAVAGERRSFASERRRAIAPYDLLGVDVTLEQTPERQIDAPDRIEPAKE